MANEIIISESGAQVGATGNSATGGTGGRDASPSLPATGRRAEIEAIMKSDMNRYYRDGLDKEYGALLEGRSTSGGRQGQIEAIMATDINRYYREGLDRELAALMERGDTSTRGGEDPTVPMPARDSRDLMLEDDGAGLVGRWSDHGGFEANLEVAQRNARQVVNSIGDHREQRVFLEHFDREVPATARYAVYEELRQGRPTFIRPATDGEVKLFATTETGKALVRQWGRDAPEKVAVLRYRARRLSESMYDEVDADVFWEWLFEQGPATSVPLFDRMAG